MINEGILKNEERVALSLRSLYARFGYSRYKMSKFEEYELYVRNKDFLISDGIITFTDQTGKLLALKPDVTLSIVKNSVYEKGLVQKLYYDEKVYRTARQSRSFKEINQTGLECIGDVDSYCSLEVLYLALRSLELIDENYIMSLSHAGLLAAALEEAEPEYSVRKKLYTYIKSKNSDGIQALCQSGELSSEGRDKALVFCEDYKDAAALRERILSLFSSEELLCELEDFCLVMKGVERLSLSDRISIDFSIADGSSYYSGLVFKGYIRGIPNEVLSGGRYDRLMKKMGKSSRAIGFAVYLDELERHGEESGAYDYDYVIIKDAATDEAELILRLNELSASGERVGVLENLPEGITFRELIDMRKAGER